MQGTRVDGLTLETGTVIDRYGSPRCSYTSPEGIGYGERALPYIENPNAYHQYRVVKPIDNVSKGEIAPASILRSQFTSEDRIGIGNPQTIGEIIFAE